MPHYGTLSQAHFGREAEDIRGANLYGADNTKLGTIDDVIFNHDTGEIEYAVVDTGGWLRSKRFIVPADRIHAHRERPDDFTSELLKERVERFPEYNEDAVARSETWRDYETRYQEAYEDGPVMHREDDNRSVTPPTEQIPVETGGDRSIEGRDLTPERLTPKFQPSVPRTMMDAQESPVRSEGARTTGSPRWDAFATRLRQRRPDLIRDCPHCAPGKERVA